MKIRLGPFARCSRSYSRVDASPARRSRRASPRLLAARKAAFSASRSELKRPSFPGSVGIKAREPALAAGFAHDQHLYIESVPGQMPTEPFRPFDDRGALVQGLVQADLVGLAGV